MSPTNEKLEALLKGFKPEFGNTAHIAIIEQIGKVQKLRSAVEKHDKRMALLRQQTGSKTITQKNLTQAENNLIFALTEASK